MLWHLQKTQEYWWYVEAFCKCHQHKNLVQTPERITQFRFKSHILQTRQKLKLKDMPYCFI